MVFIIPWRHVVLLSELSRSAKQDCICDEGDAMEYFIQAYRLVFRQACGESNVKV